MLVTDHNEAWPEVEEKLEAAMLHSLGLKADVLLREIERGNAQLWVCGSLAAVTRVWQTNRRICEIWALGGENFEEHGAKLVGEIKEFGLYHGCDAVVATGRPGWRKEFKKHGFALSKITGVCELGAGHA